MNWTLEAGEIEHACELLMSLESKEDAARAYDSYAKKIHGDFCQIEFPKKGAGGVIGVVLMAIFFSLKHECILLTRLHSPNSDSHFLVCRQCGRRRSRA